jgi:predicted dehydrogenase
MLPRSRAQRGSPVPHNMATLVRFALVGAGAIGERYAPVFAESRIAELVAVVDLNLEAAARIADGFGCRIFDSHASLLRAGGFDAAVICTPPSTHAFITLDLLRCGIHVLCEKPLSIEVASARRMLHVAERTGVQLAMGTKFRYVGDIIQAKAFIASGLLGDVLACENSFASTLAMAGHWHANPSIGGGGVIIDKGTDSVDLLRYVCGPLTAIAAYEGARVQKLAVEDTAHVVARTATGVLGSIDLSWSCNLEDDNYLRIYGTGGAISLGWARSRFRRGSHDAWVSFGSGYDRHTALCAQLDNFCRSLRGEETLLSTAEDALASVQAIAAAYRSLRCDRWVPIDGAEGADRSTPELAAVSAGR